MKILGIDPGLATTGFGMIDYSEQGVYKLVDFGLVETTKETPHGERLNLIYSGVSAVLKKHNPEVVSIERLFFATNALTAIAVGQAIGVIKLAIQHHGVLPVDYTPMQVKLTVGGDGRADKKLIKELVKKMFKIKEKKGMKTHFDNSADAIALAICHVKKTLIPQVLVVKKKKKPVVK